MSQQQAPQAISSQNSSKPITAAFDLQTKIRTIIQDVLSATMRKLSQFNEKVQTFQKFFFTYSQRINDIDEKGKTNENTLMRLFDSVTKNKQNSQSQMIKLEQKQEKIKLQKNQLAEQIKQISKKISSINRQNENINNQFSNTKKKFLQFSQMMTTMKQQVSWKITEYVEKTAQANTQIQINSQQIKKEYFNINLALQKNKQKYQDIISTRDKQDTINQQIRSQIANIEETLKQKSETISMLNKKLEEMDTALYSKIKITQSKLQRRVDELFQNNKKIQKSVIKVDGFSKILEDIRQDSQKVKRQLLKKFQQTDQKHSQKLQKQILNINMNILNYQKSTDKKIRVINESQQKSMQLFNQKMEYLKIQIETQISSKATKMVEQKSKSQSGVATSALQQFEEKLNRIVLQNKKEMNKMETLVKDVRSEVKNQMQDLKDSVQTKITKTINSIQESSGSGVSPQFIQMINNKFQKISDTTEMKICQFSQQLSQINMKIKQVQTMKLQTQEKFQQLLVQNSNKFSQLDQKISAKVQRVLFTVTKMRGDAIIRNEFTDKQIKQIKKTGQKSCKQINTVLKLFPAIGQCINLVMCLIFDAEFSHAKIIQDSLPVSTKNSVKFQNLVQGVLYQYTQKRKPGTIVYRHKQQKKIDIVKATFQGYVQIWQDLFDNDFKNSHQFIPKTFYKKYVQKGAGLSSRNGNSPNKQLSQPQINNNSSKQVSPSKQKIGIQSDDSRSIINRTDSNSQNMNRSFHIRKTKNTTIKSRDDLIMVVQQQIKQER